MSTVSTLGQIPLTIEQREALRAALADEMCSIGLDKNDEPNDKGFILENIIDILGHY